MTWPARKFRRCAMTRKRGYRDEVDAKIALGALMAMPLREVKEKRAYACPFCKRWHLTGQDQRS